MVYYLGIFDPGTFRRASADEAPAKARFFGGSRDRHIGSRQRPCDAQSTLGQLGLTERIRGLMTRSQISGAGRGAA